VSPSYTEVAQLFSSPGNFNVTQIDTGLVYQGSGTNSAVISLWTDGGGQPGTELGAWTASGFPQTAFFSTPASPTGGQIIAGITGVQLLAGESYFLEAAPVASNTFLIWFEQDSGTALTYFRSSPSSSWTLNTLPENGAFAVFGDAITAPEPTPALLFLVGIVAITFLRRRKKIRYN
jgi:hypothetical protein